MIVPGVVVVLPNFGDEKGVADVLKLSGLNVPVLIQAYPDDLGQLGITRRRDAFCGKISVCNNLVQSGIKFSLTTKHVSAPTSEDFRADLDRFLRVGEVHHRDTALIPGLDQNVTAGYRDERAVVSDTVLLLGLCGGHLVIAGEMKLVIRQTKNRVRAPYVGIDGATAGSATTAPLICEDNLLTIVRK